MDALSQPTLDFLGLSLDAYTAPAHPPTWTAETRRAWCHRNQRIGGAQIRLWAGNPSLGHGKNALFLRTGDVFIERVERQVSHLYLATAPGAFARWLDMLVERDLAAVASAQATGHDAGYARVTPAQVPPLRTLDNGWPSAQCIELVNADGDSMCAGFSDVSAPASQRIGADSDAEALRSALRGLMDVIDEAVETGSLFRSCGPTPLDPFTDCYKQRIRLVLLDSIRIPGGDQRTRAHLLELVRARRMDEMRSGHELGRELHHELDRELARQLDSWLISDNTYDSFRAALLLAIVGEPRAQQRLAGLWPPTNSGIERAYGQAALFLLDLPPAHAPRPDRTHWYSSPGQPGATLRWLVSMARAHQRALQDRRARDALLDVSRPRADTDRDES